MAAKEYKVTVPGKAGQIVTHKVWANSAEQAARRVERESGKGNVVTQRSYVSDVVSA